jgi:putative spermidine/putrescine transport system substrate-binding protein
MRSTRGPMTYVGSVKTVRPLVRRWNLRDATARCVIGLAMGLGTTWLTSCREEHSATTQHLSVATLGFGQSQSAANNSILRPFGITKHAGIDAYAWEGEFDSLRALLKPERKLDVIEVPEDVFLRTQGSGTLRALPPVLRQSLIARGAEPSSTYAIPSGYLATVFIYGRYALHGKMVSSWLDFWDLRRLAGSRGLRDNPRGTLEAALLADRVPSSHLYPMDIGRAFRKLSTIRSSIDCWWTDDGAAIALVAKGQIAASTSWNSVRVSPDARNGAIMVFNAPRLLESRVWVLPSSSGNPSLGAAFVEFASEPSHIADRAADGAYQPPSLVDSLTTLRNEQAGVVPAPASSLGGIVLDSRWWASNGARVDTLWDRWRHMPPAGAPDPVNLCAPGITHSP